MWGVRKALGIALLAWCIAALAFSVGSIRFADLPHEAKEVIALIRAGGPFPYERDGSVFGNREGLLPKLARGQYREYTVRTPGVRDRGARRIVTGSRGGQGQLQFYYSDDHYRTFRRVLE